VVAKISELNDRALFELTGWISGHTIKHLLATVAAATIVWWVTRSCPLHALKVDVRRPGKPRPTR
jgi:hypothetical protein